ncbi:hypothetical protein ACH95_04595 [Bacillus glycinifermentans]|uniref:Uncharacterized protein n=1 Tax=Bacillus glycinifermentans TaxID=1664069 RepID=A0A0J6EC65_9BACI|nr:hypothetical protein [Bacillus glycinifermentans]ATH91869.1 hypothetical protein COP00_03910 [Bacillus glycinifermentans]KMM62915.1 hypothetical protein ACH95_04595 [Bacillus glycinifermentans]KRT92903.1 hypothetical protein AB447_221740 [Bacillus glycinifermentans]MEC0486273.1 hypothetical protein [Bacillus glycinifermentans]MEC0494987.1 hypothetical protein [Bacillus glycinifermentans]
MGIDKTKSKAKLWEYSNENLPEEAKEKYEKDIKVLEKEQQEHLKSLKQEKKQAMMACFSLRLKELIVP